MITINDKNRDDIIDKYATYILDSMKFQEIWDLAYESIRNSKDLMDNEPLENEILETYPEILTV